MINEGTSKVAGFYLFVTFITRNCGNAYLGFSFSFSEANTGQNHYESKSDTFQTIQWATADNYTMVLQYVVVPLT